MTKLIAIFMTCLFLAFPALAQKTKGMKLVVSETKLPLQYDEVLPLVGKSYGDMIPANVNSIEDFKRLSKKGGLFSKKPSVKLDLTHLCSWTYVNGTAPGASYTFWVNYHLKDEDGRTRILRVNLDPQFVILKHQAESHSLRLEPKKCHVEGDVLKVEHYETPEALAQN